MLTCTRLMHAIRPEASVPSVSIAWLVGACPGQAAHQGCGLQSFTSGTSAVGCMQAMSAGPNVTANFRDGGSMPCKGPGRQTCSRMARKCWWALEAPVTARCGGNPLMSTGTSLSPCCSRPVFPQPQACTHMVCLGTMSRLTACGLHACTGLRCPRSSAGSDMCCIKALR